MTGKEKIEEDYKKFENEISQMAEDELHKIRNKIDRTKVEAKEIGESVQRSFDKDSGRGEKKKS